MRIPLCLPLAALLLLAAPAPRAQEDGAAAPPADDAAPSPNPGMNPQQDPAQGAEQGGGDQGDGGPGGMTLDDARVNMFTLLQSFLAARQIDGLWPLKSKTEHRLLKLRLEDHELKKIRPAGPRRFSGMLAFTDVKTGKAYDADFMVDMAGSEWQVVGMKLSAGKPRKAKGKSKAKAKKDAEAPADDEQQPPADGDGSGDAQ